MQSNKIAIVPLIVLAAIVVVNVVFNLSEYVVSDPPYLYLFLNLIFWTAAGIAISFVSIRSFLRDGSLTVILINISILILGISLIIVSLVLTSSTNSALTIGTICFFTASLIQLAASVASLTGKDKTYLKDKKITLTIAYLSTVSFIGIVFALSTLGVFPLFFTVSGPTFLRQILVSSNAFLFALAFVFFGYKYIQSRSSSIFWYALGVGFIALGSFSALAIIAIGDIPTWVARISYYLGTCYFILAVIKSRGATNNVSSKWTDAFRGNQQQITNLFSKMLNGFSYHRIIVDEFGKPIDYIFLDVNDAFEKATGLKKEKVVGKKATQVIPGIEQDPVNWINIYGKVALKGETVQFENYSQQLQRWYHVSAYSPEKGYFVTIFDDITERKNAEKEIEDLAKFPLENPGAVLRVDQNGTILFANPVAQEFLNEWQTKVGEPVPQHVKQIVDNALTTQNRIEFEENLREETYSFMVAPIFAENYANLYGQTITERKKAEEKLRDSKVWEATSVYTRNLIETSLDPLITISAEGKITDVNKATENATGRSREELIGSDFSNYFTEPEEAAVVYKQVFTEGTIRDYPLAIKHKSGNITEVLYNASVYRNAAGDIQGVFAAARDITERKNLEKQLQEKERLAAIGSTAGMVGHDIRNPLQAITSDVFLLRSDLSEFPEGETKENMKESLESIDQNVQYVNKIVLDLQDYARPITPAAKEVNLASLCENVLFRNEIPENINATCLVERQVKKIITDPELLKRVLTNLVNNAFQAMPQGGKITVHAYQEAEDTVITVQDTGEGIPEEVKPKLFTPLFTTKSKGQGFGLAVVKRITETLCGTVTFESKPGKGTTFTVRFPKSQTENGLSP